MIAHAFYSADIATKPIWALLRCKDRMFVVISPKNGLTITTWFLIWHPVTSLKILLRHGMCSEKT